ncbi:ATP-binding protein [Sansalvadorimonas verongulae]|uniref:ATP-binding protein n=1 Tax=Sansalvadorimonas verongulae TaxID=2172824 RepID=UPI0012BC7C26|nr:ATP-binding protein [Sansalvadorimonas verongulae]MTI14307.1 ATP-binding protein [Sansalvadorimonas verongulae]
MSTETNQNQDDKGQWLSLSINSQIEDTVLVAMAIRGVCSMIGLTLEDINRIELCVVEVVNNAIEHAYSGCSGSRVDVEVVIEPGNRLEIIVKDKGKSMPALGDIAAVQVPDPANPDTWTTSGRGLPIVEQLMDAIHYESNESGNAFHMIRQLG